MHWCCLHITITSKPPSLHSSIRDLNVNGHDVAAVHIQMSEGETKALLVVGSNEGLLCGWDVDTSDWTSELKFRFCPAPESLRTVEFCGGTRSHLLVTGGASENLSVYNTKTRRQVGTLMQHTSIVTCAAFHGASNMLSGSDDRTIAVWRCKDWSCVHLLGGHKGGVNSVSIHPSGKLALSVARDRTLRMWNLIKGRCAFIRRLPVEAARVRWAPDGQRFLIVMGTSVAVYAAGGAEAAEPCTLQHPRRVNDAVFLSPDVVASGGEDGGVVRLWRIDGDAAPCATELCTGFNTRIRALSPLRTGSKAALANMVVCSLDGCIQVWDAAAAFAAEKDGGEDLESSDEEESDGDNQTSRGVHAGKLLELQTGGDPRITTLAVRSAQITDCSEGQGPSGGNADGGGATTMADMLAQGPPQQSRKKETGSGTSKKRKAKDLNTNLDVTKKAKKAKKAKKTPGVKKTKTGKKAKK